MNAIATVMEILLRIMQWTSVECRRKIDLQCFCLYLYQTPVQTDRCFAYLMLSIKSDKRLVLMGTRSR